MIRDFPGRRGFLQCIGGRSHNFALFLCCNQRCYGLNLKIASQRLLPHFDRSPVQTSAMAFSLN